MPTQQPRFRLTIGEHTLQAEQRHGAWYFTCPSWPALAAAHDGTEDKAEIIDEFVRRALAGAVTVEETE